MSLINRENNWEVVKRADGKPVNIVEIYTVVGPNRKSKYILKEESLHKLLAPVKHMEVVLISVVGHYRRGKSFLLNYMCRFLADYKNINGWMGNGDQPLEGMTSSLLKLFIEQELSLN